MKKPSIGYAFSLPAFLFMVFFVGYPIVYNFALSFRNIDISTFNQNLDQFVGFRNYRDLISDPLLHVAIRQTFQFTVFCIVLQFLLGFTFALFFNLKFSFAEPLRGLVVVSWMIPLTVTGMLFKFMLSPGGGVINYIMLAMGLITEPIGWLVREDLALWGIILTNTWVGIPFNMILLATGMSTIPQELYESASVDGAGKFRQLLHITIPLLKPAILSVLMLGFIYTFKVFDLVFVMTGGGPVNATEVLSTVSYRLSFELYEFSRGASVANILLLILMGISLFYLRLLNSEETS